MSTFQALISTDLFPSKEKAQWYAEALWLDFYARNLTITTFEKVVRPFNYNGHTKEHRLKADEIYQDIKAVSEKLEQFSKELQKQAKQK